MLSGFSFRTCLCFLVCLTAGLSVAGGQQTGCDPGDSQIGSQEVPEGTIIYCSHVSCGKIAQRVQQDINAQEMLRRSMEENNGDLQAWSKENEEAQQAALKVATDTLFKSLLAFSAANVDSKIARMQSDLNRLAPEGETYSSKLEKVRAFRTAYAQWSGVSDGLKLSISPGMNAADTWVALLNWAANAGKANEVMSAAWAGLYSDPQLHKIIRDEGLDLLFDTFKHGLSPFLSGSVDLAQFLVSYGYDAASWQSSRQQILQRSGQSDANLLAECKLDRVLKIDVQNMNICNGHMPAPNAPNPEAIRCGAPK